MSDPSALMAFYPQIKWVHVAAISTSGTLFTLRGALLQAGRPRWAMAAPVRYFSYTVDTVLLTAALMLLTILPGAMFANGWLTVKVTLVVVYIVLGVFALNRAKTRRGRLLAYLAALATFGTIYSIARSHQPLGWWWMLTH
jgi:uncharacterized membrane protein SirB2